MKKTLLLMAVAATAMTSPLPAQEFMPLVDFIFEKAADDGHYFTFYMEGTLYVINRDDFYSADQAITFDIWKAGELVNTDAYFATGMGNIFSNDYLMVGNYNDETPAYLDAVKKEWHKLPIKEADGEAGKCNAADGITPDGKRICGGIGLAKFGIDANEPMMIPVLWEKGEDGEYGMYKVLPHPTTDFTGRTPQYITARSISADGKTIVGQVRDYNGGYPIPIVYPEDEAGEWSYRMIGRELVYDTTTVFPPYPAYEPEMPEAVDYMSEEMYEAYTEAYTQWEDSMENYYEGLIDDYPRYPQEKDYLTGEALEAYTADYARYRTENKAYEDSLNIFNKVFYDRKKVYGTSFEFNNIYVSGDGRYLASMTNTEFEDEESDWGYGIYQQAFRYDLTTGTCDRSTATSVLTTGLMNDGTLLYADPVGDICRATYTMPVGSTEGTELSDYIITRNDTLGKRFQEIMTLTPIEYDEEFNQVDGTPRIYSGSTTCNAEGTLFYGWLQNNGSIKEMGDMSYFTFYLDLNNYTPTTAIEQAAAAQSVATVITDMNGRAVATTSLKSLPQGNYIMTTKSADGSTWSAKINVH